jgi:hypothetical protein
VLITLATVTDALLLAGIARESAVIAPIPRTHIAKTAALLIATL